MEEMESLDKDHVRLQWTTDFTDKIEQLEKHQVQLLRVHFLPAINLQTSGGSLSAQNKEG